jgi:hypothetical protein
MESTEQRSLRWGQERDRLYLALKGAGLEDKLRAYEALGRRLVKEAHGSRERQEIQRRIAEDLLRASRDGPWRVFARYLGRMERLGFTAMDRRLLVCVLAAEAARGSPAGLKKVRLMIEDTEQRARRRRDWSATAEEIQRALTRARGIAGFAEPRKLSAVPRASTAQSRRKRRR